MLIKILIQCPFIFVCDGTGVLNKNWKMKGIQRSLTVYKN